METTPKHYEKLTLPKDSAWDRKKYDPILWLYHRKEEWPKWIDKTFDLWFVPKGVIRDFFEFLRRLRTWIPVLWRDRDWDDSFIFEVLKTKLFTQRRYLIENYRHTSIPGTNRDITICLNLIERFQQSYYELEYFEYYDYDFDFVEDEESEDCKGQPLFRMESTTTRDNLLEYIDKYPLDRARTIKWMKDKGFDGVQDYKENEDSRKSLALFMSQYRHEKCKRLIFLILSEKIEGWWD